MTPGATDRATQRVASRGAGPGGTLSRVSLALGASVVLHVLGMAALWRDASEPERSRAGGPLEVELVWREAARSAGAEGTGRRSPEDLEPVRPPERVSRRVEKAPGRSTVATPSRAERARPPPSTEARVEEPGAASAGEPPEATALAAPGGSEAGTPERGSPETSEGAPGGSTSGVGLSSGGGVPGAGVDSELLAYREWLSRHVTRQRRYPAQAVRLGMEGTARVRVRINRDGSLAAPPRLEGSSRFRVLDAEALRMVKAAAPFSPLPPELARESAEFVIPVSFSLRSAAG
ncbi:energy transducer TonB [Archangium violaceum]|uniref:energy transducer TonB n=1 Tax=Archangium violaceum TaxID=83451 RepID=UPI00193AF31B|nr:energy transducer TonB [Archangium violaceum]QRK10828.1 energy transducer TonB [Archangium violaceum]